MYFSGREFYSRTGAASSFSNEPFGEQIVAGFIALLNPAI
jgi:hypothetical protein